MPDFGPSSVRTRSAVERAAAFRALSLGLPQSVAKYSSNDADRVGAVAGVTLPGKKLMHIGNRQLAQNLSAQRWLEVQTHRVRVAAGSCHSLAPEDLRQPPIQEAGDG